MKPIKKLRELARLYYIIGDRYRCRAYCQAVKYLSKGTGSIGKRIKEKIKHPELLEKEIKNIKCYLPLLRIKGFGPAFIKKIKNEKITINKPEDLLKIKTISLTRIQLLGLRYYKRMIKFSRYIASKVTTEIESLLNSNGVKLNKFTVAGSYRRQKKELGDIDILIVTDHTLNKISKIISKKYKRYKNCFLLGNTKYTFIIEYKNTIIQIDIRKIPIKSYITALFYFTGSGNFGVKIRTKLKELGYKLNEYNLKNAKGKNITIKNEKDIFDILNMKYISPKNRC